MPGGFGELQMTAAIEIPLTDGRTALETRLRHPGAAGLVELIEPALVQLATVEGGPTPVLASLNLDLTGRAEVGASVTLKIWVERTTRTLVFSAAEVRLTADGNLVAAGQAVLKLVTN